MRFVIAVAAFSLAAPAAAQWRDVPPPEVELADRLNGPVVQYGVPAAIDTLLGALLETRVGGFARFTDPAEDIRPEDRLGDLVGRDDPYFRERVRDDARRSTQAMGRMAGSLAAMMPELRASADRLRGALNGLDGLDGDYYDR